MNPECRLAFQIRVIVSFAAASSLLFPISAAQAGKPPVFSLEKLDGGIYNLTSDLEKSMILLEFWGMCCRAKLSNLKHLDDLHNTYKGLKVYAINVDSAASRSRISPAIRKYGYSFPVLLDPAQEVLRKYCPSKEIPYLVLIGRSGDIQLEGAPDSTGIWKRIEESARSLSPLPGH